MGGNIMRLGLFRKGLVFATIVLFIGAGVAPSMSGDISSLITGSTLYVGGSGHGNYSSIQSAIDDANLGDIIFVYNGTYYEDIVVNKTVNLIGEDKNNTVVDGDGSGDVVSIFSDNVNISGFTIRNSGEGIGSFYYAGIILCSNSSRIYNNSILANNKGILLGSSKNNYISDNLISDNDDGLYFVASSSNTVEGNTIISNNNDGIRFNGFSMNNVVSNNDIKENYYGTWIESTPSDNTLYYNNYNNTCNAHDNGTNTWYNDIFDEGNHWSDFDESYEGAYDNNSDGIVDSPYIIPGGSNQDLYPLIDIQFDTVYVDDDFNETTNGWNITYFDNIQDGINAVEENYNVRVFNGTYHENVFINKSINLIGYYRNSTIIDGNKNGSVVYIFTDGINISGFTIQNSGSNEDDAGIKISSNHNIISENAIIDNNNGISIINSSDNTVSENEIKYNQRLGVLMQDSTKNTIIGNTISNTNHDGLFVVGESSSNNIYENNIDNNSYGICTGSSSSKNIIYHNNFRNNKDCNADDAGTTNTWYNKTLKEGNYWDDYEGIDADSDCIGDTPYNITNNNKDIYPLIDPWPLLYPPDEVYVDDDYNETTNGWNITHFDSMHDGINAIAVDGNIYVYDGTYHENLLIDKTINLIGNESDSTTIDGVGSDCVINITSNSVRISGFTIQNGIHGIHVSESNNNIISDNVIFNNEDGIYFYSSSNSQIDGNIIISNNRSGIHMSNSSINIILNNNISNNDYGIKIENSSECEIDRNTISQNTNDAIYLLNSFGNYIFENKIKDNDKRCIYLKNSPENEIDRNNFTKNKGICIDVDLGSNKTKILSNTISENNMECINVSDSHNNIISGNNIMNNERQGICIHHSSYNCINRNFIAIDMSIGIQLFDSSINNSIWENTVENVTSYGVSITDSSDNNIIYHNNFKNKFNANDKCSNVWYNTTISEGNYWSDYTGKDNDGDGIGDESYKINGDDAQDKYPFMKEDGWQYRLKFEVKGGFDETDLITGVNVVIKNLGWMSTDVEWSVSITGGLFNRIDRQLGPKIAVIQPRGELTLKVLVPGILKIKNFEFLRVGKVEILVSVGEQNWSGTGFVFGPFVFRINGSPVNEPESYFSPIGI